MKANNAGAATAPEYPVTALARKAAGHGRHGHGDKAKDKAKDKADNRGHGNAGDKDDKAKDGNSGH